MMGLMVVAGCATQRPPPPRVVARAPTHRPAAQAATQATAPAVLRSSSSAAKPSPEPVVQSDGPGTNIPLEGFRPMRGQSRSGA